MSFRLFIYYSALCGGWAAIIAWFIAKAVAPNGQDHPLASAMVQAMILGLIVTLALSLVDALWNGSLLWREIPRILVSLGVGALGGLLGGLVGQSLFNVSAWTPFVIFGWSFTGVLIGGSLASHDVVLRMMRAEDLRGALRKLIHGTLGGCLGGFIGGTLFVMLRNGLSRLTGLEPDELLSSSALGFTAIGVCIGLLIGLAQVVLKEAWIRVESGFRAGRELILTKPVTIIGRAEECDLGLYDAAGVEKIHARILQHGSEYILADAQTAGGTFVNEKRLTGPTQLRTGDQIRVGNCVLRFLERRRTEPQRARS